MRADYRLPCRVDLYRRWRSYTGSRALVAKGGDMTPVKRLARRGSGLAADLLGEGPQARLGAFRCFFHNRERVFIY